MRCLPDSYISRIFSYDSLIVIYMPANILLIPNDSYEKKKKNKNFYILMIVFINSFFSL